jgi:hypothetical protein
MSMLSRHFFSPGLGTKNIMKTHMLRLPCSEALDSMNLGSSELIKYSRCGVAPGMGIPLLKGGEYWPPIKHMRTRRPPAAAPEGVVLASPYALTPTPSWWAPVTLLPCHTWHGWGLGGVTPACVIRAIRSRWEA